MKSRLLDFGVAAFTLANQFICPGILKKILDSSHHLPRQHLMFGVVIPESMQLLELLQFFQERITQPSGRSRSPTMMVSDSHSDHEILAMGRWDTLKKVTRYTKGVRRKRLADNVLEKRKKGQE